MDLTLNGVRPASIGSAKTAPNRTPVRQRSLFPDFLAVLREEIDPHFKEVANDLYPKLTNEQASATLSRNLSGRDHRKIGVDELDTILDTLGGDAEVRVLAAFLARRGFKAPERVPDPIRVQEELATVRAGITQATGLLTDLVEALQRIEGATK